MRKVESVTVPMTYGPVGDIQIPVTINGKKGVACIAIEDHLAAVFGNPDEVGGPSDAEVAVGSFKFGKLQLFDPDGSFAEDEAKRGVDAILGMDAFKHVQIGVDFWKRTVTLWRSASTDDLKNWINGGSPSSRADSIGFETTPAPVTIRQTISGRKFKIALLSMQGRGVFTSEAAGGIIMTSESLGSPAGNLVDEKAFRYVFPGGSTTGWSWLAVRDWSAFKTTKVDGALCLGLLNVPRLIIDQPRQLFWYPTQSDLDRFARWLCLTTHVPFASVNGKIVYDPDKTIGMDKLADPPPTDSEAVTVAGFSVSTLFSAFRSNDKASGELLQKFAQAVYAKDLHVELVKDGQPIEFVLHWADAGAQQGK